MFNNCRTTHNKKVPSFGSSCESQTELELGDASSSASATTLTDGTEKDNENQIDSSNSADEAEDTFLRDVISDLCSGDQQESVSEMSDETESEDVQEGETAESVLQETALVSNMMVEDTLCQVKKFIRRFIKSTFVVLFYISEEKLQRGQSLDVYSGSIIRSRTPLIIYCFSTFFFICIHYEDGFLGYCT